MSITETPPAPTRPGGAGLPPAVLVQFLSARAAIGYTLLGLALALVVTAVVFLRLYGVWDALGSALWMGALAVFLAVLGAWSAFFLEDGRLDHARIVVILLGGVTGLWVALYGFGMLASEGRVLLNPTPLADVQFNPSALLFGLVALVLGLAGTFATLLVGRGEERRNAVLRRLLYGYNAFLTLILLLVILGVVNLLVARNMTTPIDFTADRSNSLDPEGKTRNVLQALTRPVKVYVILSPGELYGKVRTLLGNFQAVNPRITVQPVSVDSADPELTKLVEKYQDLIRGEGLLVVADDKPTDVRFIGERELETTARDANGEMRRTFQGESKLLTALSNLEATGQTTVYFTQGTGEPNLPAGPESFDAEPQLSQLAQVLGENQFEAKALPTGEALDQLVKATSDQPQVFVLTVTDRPKAPATLKALRTLCDLPDEDGTAPAGPKHNGRLVVLFAPRATPEGLAGVDRLLRDLGVEPPAQRILAIANGISAFVPVRGTLASTADNEPLARSFRRKPFVVYLPWEVRPTPPGAAAKTRAVAFLTTDSPPTEVMTFRGREALREDLRTRGSEPLPVAVLVTDPDERAVPRAAVIGSAAMVLDSPQLNRAGQKGFDFFLDVLNRLRDRPAEIGAPPRAVPTYSVGEVDLFAVLLKPALLLLAGMLALGGLVYVVRQN